MNFHVSPSHWPEHIVIHRNEWNTVRTRKWQKSVGATSVCDELCERNFTHMTTDPYRNSRASLALRNDGETKMWCAMKMLAYYSRTNRVTMCEKREKIAKRHQENQRMNLKMYFKIENRVILRHWRHWLVIKLIDLCRFSDSKENKTYFARKQRHE